MKITNYPLFTSRNVLINEKNFVYNLMIRGGLIRKLSSGIYIWLPNGVNIINNIVILIKKYMNKINAFEINMPVLNNSSIWIKSGRLSTYGNELFKIYDRNSKLFILSPTNEEVITNLICSEDFNLNFFPKVFYQIQLKFRDEIRPKLGVDRAREFIMHDVYSFHSSYECLKNFYMNILNIYLDFFKELGLNICYKNSKCGNIGGYKSHEFYSIPKHLNNCFDLINKKKNISNINVYENKNKEILGFKLICIKKWNNIKKLYNFLNVKLLVSTYLVKIYQKYDFFYVIILLSSNRKIDINKLFHIFPLSKKIIVLDNKDIIRKFNLESIFLGPLGFKYRTFVDYSLINFKNFVVGANISNFFYINVNWFLNINLNNFYDISKNININLDLFFGSKVNVSKNRLSFSEIAHIFQLSDYYTKIFYSNKLKKKIYMGCYGIGINRIISSLIECYNDRNGIIFPFSVTYFKLAILPVNMYKHNSVLNFSFKIYEFLKKNHIKILFDDRKSSFGKMITDIEFIGIPNILIISYKNLSFGLVEFKDRLNNFTKYIGKNKIFSYLLFKYKNII